MQKYVSYLINKYYEYKHSGNVDGCKRIYRKLWNLGVIL